MDRVKIEGLQSLLIIQAATDEAIKELRSDFELKIKDQIDLKKKTAEKIEVLKESISQEALIEFEKTHEKKLLGGIGIRSSEKTTQVYDSEKAFEYAKRTGTCLSLDKKAFEAIAGPLKLDFVTEKKTTVVSVTFPKKITL